MAVGDKRHYHIDEIMPRHFRQNAKTAGVAEDKIEEVFATLAKSAEAALERTVKAMPKDFPAEIVEPIGEAMRARITKTIE